jgi:hypothetical protein
MTAERRRFIKTGNTEDSDVSADSDVMHYVDERSNESLSGEGNGKEEASPPSTPPEE